jgi:hypothetical protein
MADPRFSLSCTNPAAVSQAAKPTTNVKSSPKRKNTPIRTGSRRYLRQPHPRQWHHQHPTPLPRSLIRRAEASARQVSGSDDFSWESPVIFHRPNGFGARLVPSDQAVRFEEFRCLPPRSAGNYSETQDEGGTRPSAVITRAPKKNLRRRVSHVGLDCAQL